MEIPADLQRLFDENSGILQTCIAEQAGFSRSVLSKYSKNGLIERISHGVYTSANEIADEMYSMQLRARKIIFSHETALFFHNLTDRTPFRHSITVPSGYKPSEAIKGVCKIYYIKTDLIEIGQTSVKTNMKHLVKAYDVERTICDVIRSRNKMDTQIVNDALKRYTSLKTADYNRLYQYASQLGIQNVVQKYLEVLL
jgi:predicted transcriptional regulator of viral defense system